LSLYNVSVFDEEFLPLVFRVVPFIFTFFGLGFALLLLKFCPQFNFDFIKVLRFFGAKWFFDIIYNNIIVTSLLNVAYDVTFKFVDRGFIEGLGSIGASR